MTSAVAWWLAWVRFEVQTWWLILTGRGHHPAPDSLLAAYGRQAILYNQWQNGRER